MRKNATSFIYFMCILFFLLGCVKHTNYEKDGAFIIVTYSPAGPDIMQNFYKRTISISESGSLVLAAKSSSEIEIDNDSPFFEMKLSKKEVKEIKQLIEKSKFWKHKEDISDDDSVDGTFIYITVNLTDSSKTIGGLNPDEDDFDEISEYILGLISSEDYQKWRIEIEDYIYERYPM